MSAFFIILFAIVNLISFLRSNKHVESVGNFTRKVTINNQIRTIQYTFSSPEFKNECNKLLLQKFPYYTKLSELNKSEFLKRLVLFIQSKKMVPCEMDEVTLEMRILISATAIQLTFGLDASVLSNVKGFRIYPDIYYSKLMNSRFKGHFAPNGVITLAYNHFLIGLDESDGINLGLHEMAHAFHFSFIRHHHTQYHFSELIAAWYNSIKNTPQNELNHAETLLLREYGKTNDKEFFAVCVENFFERPQQFREIMPKLYKCLCLMLNQNPLKETDKKSGEFTPNFETNPTFSLHSSLAGIVGFIPVFCFLAFIFAKLDLAFGFIFLIIVCISIVVSLSFAKTIEFCDSYIGFKNRFNSRSKNFVHHNAILYMSYLDYDTGRDAQNQYSIIYENESIKTETITVKLSYTELNQLKDYCKTNSILLVERL